MFQEIRLGSNFSYNTRKRLILAVLEGAWPNGLRADAVAGKAGVSPQRAIYDRLNRLWRWGLIGRRRDGTGRLVYRISERGRQRLAWLRQL